MIVVEHDEDAIRLADHVVDIGPGAGVHGGEIVAQGTPAEIEASPRSLTGQYLTGKRAHRDPGQAPRARSEEACCTLRGASGNNLKNVDVSIPGRAVHLRHRRVRLGQVAR